MGNANNINGAATEQIENNVLTFRETMVFLADIWAVLPQLWVFGEPVKTCFYALQVAVSLGFAPVALGVAANAFEVVPSAWSNPDFSDGRHRHLTY